MQLKYETQAPFYARDLTEEVLRAPLLRALRERVPPGGRVLVAGSGSGHECLQLAGQGWKIVGVDFSPAMIALARSRASGLPDVEYRRADLRDHEEPAGSLDAVVFTYECYSFVPGRAARVDLLRRMKEWIGAEGAIFLSAWRVRKVYDRLVLTVQWIAAGGRGADGWGSSHTRWIAPDGSMHRSCKAALTARALRREARDAGLRVGVSSDGHLALTP